MIEVICGDVRNLPDIGRFHAILCDPPYELGFMNKSWDASGVAYDAEMWRGLLALLHPGGFGMAFGGSRTYHRLACAIEDAGAVLHPMIGWAYGSGFPKATRIDTQVDRAAGAEREVVGQRDTFIGGKDQHAFNAYRDRIIDVTLPATPLAATWAGHRYGLQALKPALEPICCFQRPYRGKPWECITETGAGAMNIEASRVPTNGESLSGGMINGTSAVSEGWDRPWRRDPEAIERNKVIQAGRIAHAEQSGRWPANLVLCHEPGCNGTCEDGCAVRKLGEQSGERSGPGGYCDGNKAKNGDMWPMSSRSTRQYPGQSGTASRFFTQVGWQLEQAEPLFYQAKASRAERNYGLNNPGTRRKHNVTTGGKVGAAPERPGANNHPTVKPIALAKHLATLLLPPPEYAPRRILVPFAGSGSEMIGAMLAGWEEVVGIEQDAEYCELARARIAHWMRQPALAEVAA